jgi:hypothetical protein
VTELVDHHEHSDEQEKVQDRHERKPQPRL